LILLVIRTLAFQARARRSQASRSPMGQRDGGDDALMVGCGGGSGLRCMCNAVLPREGPCGQIPLSGPCPCRLVALAPGRMVPSGRCWSGLRCRSMIVLHRRALLSIVPDVVPALFFHAQEKADQGSLGLLPGGQPAQNLAGLKFQREHCGLAGACNTGHTVPFVQGQEKSPAADRGVLPVAGPQRQSV